MAHAALPPKAVEQTEAVVHLRVSTREQASTGGEAEGYSIPAQRQACVRRAEQLGAVVVEEFVDAGASARSADRPELQRLLAYLREHPVSYVIVHKVDRLARSRVDDVAINLVIQQAGAQLISCSENIDETPSGMLLHGIMSSIAEFYSRNLANEVVKGTQQKVAGGGTPYVAPIGYLNVRTLVNGVESRTIEVDPERGPLIQWAFETYASGDYSLGRLANELELNGLTQRPTAKRATRLVPINMLHRLLQNRYYLGLVIWRGVEYAGKHPALVDPVTFEQVQRVMTSHRRSGERPSRHTPYLTGTVFCGRCGSRLVFSLSRGANGQQYPYYFCIGRQLRRTRCDLPSLPVDAVEDAVAEQWQAETMPVEIASALEADVLRRLEDAEDELVARAGVAGERVHQLKRQRYKWAEMAMEGSVPSDIAREKQRELGDQLATAEAEVARLTLRGRDHYQLIRRVALLLQSCGEMYAGSDEVGRRELNLAWFRHLEIDEDDRTGRPKITVVERTPIIEAMQEHNPQLVGRPRPAADDEEGPQLSLRAFQSCFMFELELSGRGDRI